MNLYHKYKNWQYKNTFLLALSITLLIYFSGTDFVTEIIARIGNYGYVSAFFAGAFFVSIFTVAPAAVVLYDLADKLNPLLVAVVAGAGAMVGDYILFNFFRDNVFEELTPLTQKIPWPKIVLKTFKTPYFSWAIPLVGAFVIASPVPDEIGIAMMGLCNIKKWQFLLVTFLLNALGILAVVSVAKLV